MHAGEVFLIIFFNCVIFVGFYYAYIRIMERKLRRLKSEIEELEDLVAAIIEEFEEAAASNENETFALPETAASAENAPISGVVDPGEIKTSSFSQPDAIPDINPTAEWIQPQSEQSSAKTVQATDPRHKRIVELWRDGIPVEEIARQLGTGRGEVQLVLGIYQKM